MTNRSLLPYHRMPFKMITSVASLLIVLLFPGYVGLAKSGGLAIQAARLWTAPDHSRVVLDLNGPVKYRLFHLKSPNRIVVDLHNIKLNTQLNTLAKKDPVLAAIRYGKPKKGILRLVMDVKENVRPRSFLLKPMHGKPYRLVIDLMRKPKHVHAAVTVSQIQARKKIILAIDAGHGGEDPGATGPHGLKEKNVTLAIAKKLARAINAQRGMRAVLLRKGDYFVPLMRRVTLARRAKADILISIHADAVKERNVAGASVYTMSEKGASDHVASMLARKENASDAIGGVSPGEVQDPLVRRILADLIKRDSLNSSELLADEILKHIRHIGPIKYGVPKHARFVVLRAPEIPSVLVELDYISNPKRERLLRSSKHQKQLATALLQASKAFLKRQGRLSLLNQPAPIQRVQSEVAYFSAP